MRIQLLSCCRMQFCPAMSARQMIKHRYGSANNLKRDPSVIARKPSYICSMASLGPTDTANDLLKQLTESKYCHVHPNVQFTLAKVSLFPNLNLQQKKIFTTKICHHLSYFLKVKQANDSVCNLVQGVLQNHLLLTNTLSIHFFTS